MLRHRWFGGVALSVLGWCAAGTGQSGPGQAGIGGAGTVAAAPKVVLVELFTSEGCSSCPPADALLGRLNGLKTEAGQLIVGISEHVTYWNHLGWVDPFSQELFTLRQQEYSGRFRTEDVYTPQMVVNGESAMVGSDGRAVQAALRKAGQGAEGSLRIGEVVPAGKMLMVTYDVAGIAPGAEVYAVVAEDHAASQVLRGENAGRGLAHVSVAQSMIRLGKVKAPGSQKVAVSLPKGDGGGRHLIVFVQAAGLGRVLAADTKAL